MSEKINSMKRTLRVLSYICHQKNGVKIAELAKAFNTSSPAIYNYLKNMQEEGFIFKDEMTGRFRATYRVVDLASIVMGNNDLTEITYPLLSKLSEKINSSVHLAIREGDLGVCVSKVGTSSSIPSITRVGMSFELYPTALGKAILAYLPQKELKDYLDKTEFIPYTEKTISNREELKKELERTKKRGYSIDNEEHRKGLHAMGVPIFDYTNHVIGAISVLIPASISQEETTELYTDLHQAALDISHKLGNRHLFEDDYIVNEQAVN